MKSRGRPSVPSSGRPHTVLHVTPWDVPCRRYEDVPIQSNTYLQGTCPTDPTDVLRTSPADVMRTSPYSLIFNSKGLSYRRPEDVTQRRPEDVLKTDYTLNSYTLREKIFVITNDNQTM